MTIVTTLDDPRFDLTPSQEASIKDRLPEVKEWLRIELRKLNRWKQGDSVIVDVTRGRR